MPEANISGLGSPAPDEPFSSSSSGTSPILGTNQLQGIVDHFGQIVDKLSALYDKACGSADASGLPGIKGSPASSNAGGPSFPQTPASGAGIYSATQAQPGQVGARAPGLNMWSAGGNGQGFMGQASFGGQPGAPGVTVPVPGNGGIPGGQSIGAFAGNAFAAAGSSKLGTQVAFSNYLQQAYTFSGGQPGGTGLNNRMLAQALGRPGAWNTIATGPGDALSGTAVMQQAAGRWNLTGPGSNPLSRTMQGDAMGMGYATGSSMTEAGSLSTWLNSPMTSYRMMMMGFPVQPRQPYGQGPNQGYGNVLAGINKYSFGKDTVDPGKAQSFYSTYGAGYQELLGLTGGDQAMASQLAKTSVDMNNAVFNSKKNTGRQLDWNQVQGLLDKAGTGDKGARSTLDKLGISETEQQRLKDTTASKTGGSAELFNSFQSGLTSSTAALNAFTNVINAIIKLPGVNQIIGGAGGVSAVGGPAGSLLNIAKNYTTGNLGGALTSGLHMIPGLSSIGLAHGGVLGGYAPGKDTVPVLASPGEGWLVPEAVQGIGGAATINALNKKYAGHRGAGYPGVSKSGQFASGGVVPAWPFPTRSSSQYRRIDEGWDLQYGGTKPVNVLAVASGTIGTAGPDPNGFGISYPLLHLDKPIDGFSTIYYGHTFPGPKGHVTAGQPVGHTGGAHSGGNAANDPNWLEIGFWPPSFANGKKMHDWLMTGKATGGKATTGGTGGGTGISSATTSSSSPVSSSAFGGMGSPSSTSEADNVAAGLAGGFSGGTGTAPSSPGTSSGTSSPASATSSGSSKRNTNVSTAGGGSAAANRALGKKIAAQMFGWKGAQWNALDKLWGTYESGWRNDAQNPSSTAYGIAQFLDSTWAPYGPKTSNPGLQEKYGMEYIRDRYKDPIHALAFELSHTPHWYSAGTNSAKAGAAVLGERGPELALLSGGQKIFDAKQTQEMLQSAKRPAQTPWKSGPGQGPGDSCGHSVQLTFAPGSIVIGGGNAAGTRWDTSNSAREFVRKVKKQIESEDLYGAIAAGKKAS